MLSEREAQPLSLTTICRTRIRQLIGRKRLKEITSLPLPLFLNNFIAFSQ
ncbi:hypothetical protein CAPTEDRAFT_184047 [Capitella teleta]|uniref:SOCS box domain-containing protein n=1 Tax=Capitella teleta TaxID=283909 RepID=R7TAW7_CAPTE|nr:hypothetical protein CAPTEDRAFT_184047 [Capitella teleta]|eukprot:ELT90868.1 hypothetical protein CAPTEDRAFT_184047 [Capitella teleta]